MSATYTMDFSDDVIRQNVRLPGCLRVVGFEPTRRRGVVRAVVQDADAPPELDGKHVLPMFQQRYVEGEPSIAEVVGREVIEQPPEICYECQGSGVCRLCEGEGHFE